MSKTMNEYDNSIIRLEKFVNDNPDAIIDNADFDSILAFINRCYEFNKTNEEIIEIIPNILNQGIYIIEYYLRRYDHNGPAIKAKHINLIIDGTKNINAVININRNSYEYSHNILTLIYRGSYSCYSESEHEELLLKLIDLGIDLNFKCRYGENNYKTILNNNYLYYFSTFKLFIDNGAICEYKKFIIVISYYSCNEIEYIWNMIGHNYDITPELLNTVCKSEYISFDKLEFVLNKLLTLDKPLDEFYTPDALHNLLNNKVSTFDMIKLLLEFNEFKYINEKYNGWYPISRICARRDVTLDMIKYMINNGADIMVKTYKFKNSLQPIYNNSKFTLKLIEAFLE